MVKNPPVNVGDPWVRKIPMEEGMATHSSILAWRIRELGAWQATVHGVTQNWTRLKRLITHACTYLKMLPVCTRSRVK